MNDVSRWDAGATNYVPIFGENALREAQSQQDAQNREKEQSKERRLGLREIDVDMATMDRITRMLLTHDSDRHQHLNTPRLRKSDVRNLRLVENLWHILYNPDGGVGYNPHAKFDSSMQGLAQILGDNPSPFQESAEHVNQQTLLQNLGLRLVSINQIDGSVDTHHTHPTMRISYDRSPFQAIRMRSLLRVPKPQQKTAPSTAVKQVA